MFRKLLAILVSAVFLLEQTGYAQVAPQMGVPQYLQGLVAADKFRPMHLRSVSFEPERDSLLVNIEQGDDKKAKSSQAEETAAKLLEYFKVGLALPNSTFWVNLRPDAADQIVDPLLEKTDLGKILLEADLQLKKDMAALTSPATPEGRQYWNKLYARAEILFPGQEADIPTYNRPWIVPGEIILGVGQNNSAYVYKATLKVLLESDALTGSAAAGQEALQGPAITPSNDIRILQLNEYSAQLIKQLILPKLTRQINSSKKYAHLRQAYYSLILAQWFKQKFSPAEKTDSVFVSSIDSKDISRLGSKTAWNKETYFKAYQDSFNKGEYSKEETVSSPGGLTVRRYFSGGFKMSADLFARDAVSSSASTAVTIVPITRPIPGTMQAIIAPGGQLTLTMQPAETVISAPARHLNADGGSLDPANEKYLEMPYDELDSLPVIQDLFKISNQQLSVLYETQKATWYEYDRKERQTFVVMVAVAFTALVIPWLVVIAVECCGAFYLGYCSKMQSEVDASGMLFADIINAKKHGKMDPQEFYYGHLHDGGRISRFRDLFRNLSAPPAGSYDIDVLIHEAVEEGNIDSIHTLGLLGDERALPPLENIINKSDLLASGLGALRDIYRHEKVVNRLFGLQKEAVWAVGRIGSKKGLPILRDIIFNKSWYTRPEALYAVKNTLVRAEALRAWSRIETVPAEAFIQHYSYVVNSNGQSMRDRVSALRSIASIGNDAALRALMSIAEINKNSIPLRNAADEYIAKLLRSGISLPERKDGGKLAKALMVSFSRGGEPLRTPESLLPDVLGDQGILMVVKKVDGHTFHLYKDYRGDQKLVSAMKDRIVEQLSYRHGVLSGFTVNYGGVKAGVLSHVEPGFAVVYNEGAEKTAKRLYDEIFFKEGDVSLALDQYRPVSPVVDLFRKLTTPRITGIEQATKLLYSSNRRVALLAMRYLNDRFQDEDFETVMQRFNESDGFLRAVIMYGLGMRKDARAVEPLLKELDTARDRQLIRGAGFALARIGKPALAGLLELAKKIKSPGFSWDSDNKSWTVLLALEAIGDPAAIPVFERFCDDDYLLEATMVRAIERISLENNIPVEISRDGGEEQELLVDMQSHLQAITERQTKISSLEGSSVPEIWAEREVVVGMKKVDYGMLGKDALELRRLVPQASELALQVARIAWSLFDQEEEIERLRRQNRGGAVDLAYEVAVQSRDNDHARLEGLMSELAKIVKPAVGDKDGGARFLSEVEESRIDKWIDESLDGIKKDYDREVLWNRLAAIGFVSGLLTATISAYGMFTIHAPESFVAYFIGVVSLVASFERTVMRRLSFKKGTNQASHPLSEGLRKWIMEEIDDFTPLPTDRQALNRHLRAFPLPQGYVYEYGAGAAREHITGAQIDHVNWMIAQYFVKLYERAEKNDQPFLQDFLRSAMEEYYQSYRIARDLRRDGGSAQAHRDANPIGVGGSGYEETVDALRPRLGTQDPKEFMWLMFVLMEMSVLGVDVAGIAGPQVRRYLQHDNAGFRAVAAFISGMINDTQAKQALSAALVADDDQLVRRQAKDALFRLADASSRDGGDNKPLNFIFEKYDWQQDHDNRYYHFLTALWNAATYGFPVKIVKTGNHSGTYLLDYENKDAMRKDLVNGQLQVTTLDGAKEVFSLPLKGMAAPADRVVDMIVLEKAPDWFDKFTFLNTNDVGDLGKGRVLDRIGSLDADLAQVQEFFEVAAVVSAGCDSLKENEPYKYLRRAGFKRELIRMPNAALLDFFASAIGSQYPGEYKLDVFRELVKRIVDDYLTLAQAQRAVELSAMLLSDEQLDPGMKLKLVAIWEAINPQEAAFLLRRYLVKNASHETALAEALISLEQKNGTNDSFVSVAGKFFVDKAKVAAVLLGRRIKDSDLPLFEKRFESRRASNQEIAWISDMSGHYSAAKPRGRSSLRMNSKGEVELLTGVPLDVESAYHNGRLDARVITLDVKTGDAISEKQVYLDNKDFASWFERYQNVILGKREGKLGPFKKTFLENGDSLWYVDWKTGHKWELKNSKYIDYKKVGEWHLIDYMPHFVELWTKPAPKVGVAVHIDSMTSRFLELRQLEDGDKLLVLSDEIRRIDGSTGQTRWSLPFPKVKEGKLILESFLFDGDGNAWVLFFNGPLIKYKINAPATKDGGNRDDQKFMNVVMQSLAGIGLLAGGISLLHVSVSWLYPMTGSLGLGVGVFGGVVATILGIDQFVSIVSERVKDKDGGELMQELNLGFLYVRQGEGMLEVSGNRDFAYSRIKEGLVNLESAMVMRGRTPGTTNEDAVRAAIEQSWSAVWKEDDGLLKDAVAGIRAAMIRLISEDIQYRVNHDPQMRLFFNRKDFTSAIDSISRYLQLRWDIKPSVVKGIVSDGQLPRTSDVLAIFTLFGDNKLEVSVDSIGRDWRGNESVRELRFAVKGQESGMKADGGDSVQKELPLAFGELLLGLEYMLSSAGINTIKDLGGVSADDFEKALRQREGSQLVFDAFDPYAGPLNYEDAFAMARSGNYLVRVYRTDAIIETDKMYVLYPTEAEYKRLAATKNSSQKDGGRSSLNRELNVKVNYLSANSHAIGAVKKAEGKNGLADTIKKQLSHLNGPAGVVPAALSVYFALQLASANPLTGVVWVISTAIGALIAVEADLESAADFLLVFCILLAMSCIGMPDGGLYLTNVASGVFGGLAGFFGSKSSQSVYERVRNAIKSFEAKDGGQQFIGQLAVLTEEMLEKWAAGEPNWRDREVIIDKFHYLLKQTGADESALVVAAGDYPAFAPGDLIFFKDTNGDNHGVVVSYNEEKLTYYHVFSHPIPVNSHLRKVENQPLDSFTNLKHLALPVVRAEFYAQAIDDLEAARAKIFQDYPVIRPDAVKEEIRRINSEIGRLHHKIRINRDGGKPVQHKSPEEFRLSLDQALRVNKFVTEMGKYSGMIDANTVFRAAKNYKLNKDDIAYVRAVYERAYRSESFWKAISWQAVVFTSVLVVLIDGLFFALVPDRATMLASIGGGAGAGVAMLWIIISSDLSARRLTSERGTRIIEALEGLEKTEKYDGGKTFTYDPAKVGDVYRFIDNYNRILSKDEVFSSLQTAGLNNEEMVFLEEFISKRVRDVEIITAAISSLAVFLGGIGAFALLAPAMQPAPGAILLGEFSAFLFAYLCTKSYDKVRVNYRTALKTIGEYPGVDHRDGGESTMEKVTSMRLRLADTQQRNVLYEMLNKAARDKDAESLLALRAKAVVLARQSDLENLQQGDMVFFDKESTFYYFIGRNGQVFDLETYPTRSRVPMSITLDGAVTMYMIPLGRRPADMQMRDGGSHAGLTEALQSLQAAVNDREYEEAGAAAHFDHAAVLKQASETLARQTLIVEDRDLQDWIGTAVIFSTSDMNEECVTTAIGMLVHLARIMDAMSQRANKEQYQPEIKRILDTFTGIIGRGRTEGIRQKAQNAHDQVRDLLRDGGKRLALIKDIDTSGLDTPIAVRQSDSGSIEVLSDVRKTEYDQPRFMGFSRKRVEKTLAKISWFNSNGEYLNSSDNVELSQDDIDQWQDERLVGSDPFQRFPTIPYNRFVREGNLYYVARLHDVEVAVYQEVYEDSLVDGTQATWKLQVLGGVVYDNFVWGNRRYVYRLVLVTPSGKQKIIHDERAGSRFIGLKKLENGSILVMLQDGIKLVNSYQGETIWEINADFHYVDSIDFDRRGNVWVLDGNNLRMFGHNPQTTLDTYIGSSRDGGAEEIGNWLSKAGVGDKLELDRIPTLGELKALAESGFDFEFGMYKMEADSEKVLVVKGDYNQVWCPYGVHGRTVHFHANGNTIPPDHEFYRAFQREQYDYVLTKDGITVYGIDPSNGLLEQKIGYYIFIDYPMGSIQELEENEIHFETIPWGQVDQKAVLQFKSDWDFENELRLVMNKDAGKLSTAKPGMAVDKSEVGGIDLRALPLNAVPLTPAQIVPAISGNMPVADLDKEWAEIVKQMQSGPMPYDKLKAHVRQCCGRQEVAQHVQEVSACVMKILESEEDAAVATAPELKEVLCCLS